MPRRHLPVLGTPEVGVRAIRDRCLPCAFFVPGEPSHGNDCEGDGHYLCAECRRHKWRCAEYEFGTVTLAGACEANPGVSLVPCETCKHRRWNVWGATRYDRIVVGSVGVLGRMAAPEVYVSVDVETDGPLPGPNSMLSLGAAAFLADGTSVGTFEVNFETLPGAQPDPSTAAWWATQPEAWAACRVAPQDPVDGTKLFVAWVKTLPGSPVFVAYPAGFDFLFVYTYMIRFAGESPFSFSALDVKSFAMAVLGLPYRETTKRNMPKAWFSKRKHSHVALADAIGQGELFLQALKASRAKTTDKGR